MGQRGGESDTEGTKVGKLRREIDDAHITNSFPPPPSLVHVDATHSISIVASQLKEQDSIEIHYLTRT